MAAPVDSAPAARTCQRTSPPIRITGSEGEVPNKNRRSALGFFCANPRGSKPDEISLNHHICTGRSSYTLVLEM